MRQPPVLPAIERGEMSAVSGARLGSALIFVWGQGRTKTGHYAGLAVPANFFLPGLSPTGTCGERERAAWIAITTTAALVEELGTEGRGWRHCEETAEGTLCA